MQHEHIHEDSATVHSGEHDAGAAVAAHPRHAVHQAHAGHEHDKHAGHDPNMFRRRFWLSLVLTVPIVVTSEMVMDWFGYTLDVPGMSWVGPVLGSVVSSTAAGRSWSAACARSVTGRRG